MSEEKQGESGFLTEFWRSQAPLPKIRGHQVLLYYLKRGFNTVFAVPASSAITVLTIAVSLFLLAGFLLIVQNVGELIVSAGNTLYVTMYLEEASSENEILSFVDELNANPNIQSVQYISKKEALQIFRNGLGSSIDFTQGLDENNPLPASIDVAFQPGRLIESRIESTLDPYRQHKVVDEIVYGSEWVDQVQRLIKVFHIFGLIGLVVTIGITLFLISNTIKLVMYSRRDEILIMQLVGASDSFVRIPFFVGGLLQGLMGALLSLGLLKLGFLVLDLEMGNSHIFGIIMPEIAFLDPGVVIGLVVFGLVVGAVGSLLSLGRLMHA